MQSKKQSTPVVTPAPTAFEPILTIEQVAERLQMKVSTVRELMRKRNARPLPALKCGGKLLRFRWSRIEQWLDGGAA